MQFVIKQMWGKQWWIWGLACIAVHFSEENSDGSKMLNDGLAMLMSSCRIMTRTHNVIPNIWNGLRWKKHQLSSQIIHLYKHYLYLLTILPHKSFILDSYARWISVEVSLRWVHQLRTMKTASSDEELAFRQKERDKVLSWFDRCDVYSFAFFALYNNIIIIYIYTYYVYIISWLYIKEQTRAHTYIYISTYIYIYI